ncbi:cyanoexosortase B system-associated protein [filamentous cyanobacterium CCP5]|nr:cyanoexosortase B system-associated protein [filamentous cyanobacterium CCP5]
MNVPMGQWQPKPSFKAALVLTLSAIAALVLTPHWVAGQWPWSQSLQAPGLDRIQALTTDSLSLPGWAVSSTQAVSINNQTWNLSEYEQVNSDSPGSGEINRIALLLMPQAWHDVQPTVEWIDLQGAQNWRIAHGRTLTFTAGGSQVRARYFQARTDAQTFAILQWYAWPGGGDFAPSRWFWADQLSQWQSGQRTPWVAVSLLLPIPPLADITAHRETATQLGEAIQTALLTTALTGERPAP